MKRILALLLLGAYASICYSNIYQIDFTKISSKESDIALFGSIVENSEYYSYWTPQWNYEVEKTGLVALLEQAYNSFSAIKADETELNLLLGLVSHYLYNLEQHDYTGKPEEHYLIAGKASPNDLRPAWFLAKHYALSNDPGKAVPEIIKAKTLLTSAQPPAFWEDYAFVTYLAGMFSHTKFAMDQYNRITGEVSYMESTLGEVIHSKFAFADKSVNWKKEDIWSATVNEKVMFRSNPLGIGLLSDTAWNINVLDYENRNTAFLITPAAEKNKGGREITYTIAILIHPADENEKLEDYIKKFVEKTKDKKKIKFSDKYEGMIAWQLKDKNMYKEIGGANMYVLGIERTMPVYPGMLLESPVSLPGKENEELVFYDIKSKYNRFEGKIFYCLILDTCEDIFPKSEAVFKAFFEKDLIIE